MLCLGFLQNREDARISEKIAAWIPFLPKNDVGTIARAMRIEAEARLQGLDDKFDKALGVKGTLNEGAKYYFYPSKTITEILKFVSF